MASHTPRRSPYTSHNISLEGLSPKKTIDPPEEETKPETKSFVKKSWNHFQEFSDSTTIHGVKYLGEKGRPFFERVLWLLILSGCIFFLSRFILDIYKKWEQTPTIISRNNRPTSISDIPFPSITVCPYTRISSNEFEKLKADKNSRNGLYYHLCDADELPSTGSGANDEGSDTVKNIKSVATDVTDLFGSCDWNQEPSSSCDQLFKPILTDDGICYTFNFVAETIKYPQIREESKSYFEQSARDWKFQNGYENKDLKSSYPRRPWLYGKQNKFGFLLNSRSSDETQNLACKPLDNGYKIIISSPGIFPHTGILNSDVIIINHQSEVDIEIEPSQIHTSEDLRSYSIENRQCFFEHERELNLFNIYNEQNCKLECLISRTYNQCGCVKYSMVHKPEQEICGLNQISCVKGVVDSELNLTSQTDTMQKHCDCLPECNSIKYETKVIQRNVDLRSIEDKLSNTTGSDSKHTVVNVYFRSREFTGSSRNELYGISDFVSNIGGLLGLFMGTSIVSLIDVFYFGSVRIYSNYYHNAQ